MAHGLNSVLKRNPNAIGTSKSDGKTGGIGSRRIFAPQFKLQVLDSYRNDADCKGNQRATARKYGIHRRQIQKWLQVETNLRNSVMKMKQSSGLIVHQPQQQGQQADPETKKCGPEVALSKHRQRDDTSPVAYSQCSDSAACTPTAEHCVLMPNTIAEQRVPYINIPSQRHSPAAYSESSCSTVPVCVSPEAHRVPCGGSSPPRIPLLHTPEPMDTSNVVTNNTDSALDFSTHARNIYHPRIPDREYTDYSGDESYLYEPHIPIPCYPIDLSIKKHQPSLSACLCDPIDPHTPVPSQIPPATYCPLNTTLCSNIEFKFESLPMHAVQPYYLQNNTELNCLQTNTEYEIWDLSTKTNTQKRKLDPDDSYNNVSSSSGDAKAPFVETSPVKKPVKLFKPYLDDDDYSSSSSSVDSRIYHIQDIYSESRIKSEIVNECTDQPENELVYNNNNNIVNKSPMDTYPHIVSYYSPIITSSYDYVPYVSETNTNSPKAELKTANNALKQRQSYSLNFKLSAIECYYNDSICRGNQRAVASKYKIHRRQVQKWLKQEHELRDRIQSDKPIQAVS